ncbi:collagen alpha-4(IV) chain-like [Symphalangus syndactylus]|uniref:collagen alpha-4(IV) chain-like n=1 Tax=Symphalangus syndactylus TaxID=9590 RepID=UPI003003E7EC
MSTPASWRQPQAGLRNGRPTLVVDPCVTGSAEPGPGIAWCHLSRGSRRLPGDQRGSGRLPGDQRGSRRLPGDQRGSGRLPGDRRGSGRLPGNQLGQPDVSGGDLGREAVGCRQSLPGCAEAAVECELDVGVPGLMGRWQRLCDMEIGREDPKSAPLSLWVPRSGDLGLLRTETCSASPWWSGHPVSHRRILGPQALQKRAKALAVGPRCGWQWPAAGRGPVTMGAPAVRGHLASISSSCCALVPLGAAPGGLWGPGGLPWDRQLLGALKPVLPAHWLQVSGWPLAPGPCCILGAVAAGPSRLVLSEGGSKAGSVGVGEPGSPPSGCQGDLGGTQPTLLPPLALLATPAGSTRPTWRACGSSGKHHRKTRGSVTWHPDKNAGWPGFQSVLGDSLRCAENTIVHRGHRKPSASPTPSHSPHPAVSPSTSPHPLPSPSPTPFPPPPLPPPPPAAPFPGPGAGGAVSPMERLTAAAGLPWPPLSLRQQPGVLWGPSSEAWDTPPGRPASGPQPESATGSAVVQGPWRCQPMPTWTPAQRTGQPQPMTESALRPGAGAPGTVTCRALDLTQALGVCQALQERTQPSPCPPPSAASPPQ